MNNLTYFFKGMKLEQAWQGDFDFLANTGMPLEQLQQLQVVCENAPTDAADIYRFLADKDFLFRSIYKKEKNVSREEQFVFPFIKGKTIPDGIKEVVGPIGTQTSKYHHETLQQHAAVVAANLVDVGIEKALAVKLALLHDIGKKYTSATNKIGEVCFYEHAPVSAFIAGYWLRQWPISKRLAKKIVAVIYSHTFPYASWNITKHWKTGEPVDYRRDFYKRQLIGYCSGNTAMADYIMSLIDTFAKCDEGILEFNSVFAEKFIRGYGLIHE